MKKKRKNLAILVKGCFQIYKYMYPAVMHAPSKDSKTSTLVMTDALNQKVEHSTIRWEDLSFPTEWVIDTPKLPIQKAITSAQIKETGRLCCPFFSQILLTEAPHGLNPFVLLLLFLNFVYILLYKKFLIN
jgi:hypothetical protein